MLSVSQEKSSLWDRVTPHQVKHLVAGGIAGAVSRTSVSPFERLKILYQVMYACLAHLFYVSLRVVCHYMCCVSLCVVCYCYIIVCCMSLCVVCCMSLVYVLSATDSPPKPVPRPSTESFLPWVVPQTMYGCHRWSLGPFTVP